MGLQNVSQAGTVAAMTDVPATARLVYYEMCILARDPGMPVKQDYPEGDERWQPQRYWAGPEHLALKVFGSTEPSPMKQVERAIKQLRLAGLIRHITTGGKNRRAMYEVCLDSALVPLNAIEAVAEAAQAAPKRRVAAAKAAATRAENKARAARQQAAVVEAEAVVEAVAGGLSPNDSFLSAPTIRSSQPQRFVPLSPNDLLGPKKKEEKEEERKRKNSPEVTTSPAPVDNLATDPNGEPT